MEAIFPNEFGKCLNIQKIIMEEEILRVYNELEENNKLNTELQIKFSVTLEIFEIYKDEVSSAFLKELKNELEKNLELNFELQIQYRVALRVHSLSMNMIKFLINNEIQKTSETVTKPTFVSDTFVSDTFVSDTFVSDTFVSEWNIEVPIPPFNEVNEVNEVKEQKEIKKHKKEKKDIVKDTPEEKCESFCEVTKKKKKPQHQIVSSSSIKEDRKKVKSILTHAKAEIDFGLYIARNIENLPTYDEQKLIKSRSLSLDERSKIVIKKLFSLYTNSKEKFNRCLEEKGSSFPIFVELTINKVNKDSISPFYCLARGIAYYCINNLYSSLVMKILNDENVFLSVSKEFLSLKDPIPKGEEGYLGYTKFSTKLVEFLYNHHSE